MKRIDYLDAKVSSLSATHIGTSCIPKPGTLAQRVGERLRRRAGPVNLQNGQSVSAADPIATWQAHAAKLNARAQVMNQRNLFAIHFLGPGTDLLIGLSDRHTWTSVDTARANPNGVQCPFNISSNEINTVPDRDRLRRLRSDD